MELHPTAMQSRFHCYCLMYLLPIAVAYGSVHTDFYTYWEEPPISLYPYISEFSVLNSTWTTRQVFWWLLPSSWWKWTPGYLLSGILLKGMVLGVSLPCLGCARRISITCSMAAGVLKTRGDHVCFHWDRFKKGFDLLVGNMPNGIEASSCKLDDPKERSFTVRNLKRWPNVSFWWD